MDCPVCKLPMVVIEYQKLELDYCLQCLGVWFDSGEIEILLSKTGISVQEIPTDWTPGNPDHAEASRPCPICLKSMLKVTPSSGRLIIDRCPTGDGFWFDKDELRRFISEHPIIPKDGKAMSILMEFLGDLMKESEVAMTDSIPIEEEH